MVHGVGISKTERRAAIARIKAFAKEFAAKPEHSVNLDVWYYPIQGVQDKILKEQGIAHCGSVGCIGGYAVHSDLFKKYEKGLKFDSEAYNESEARFFGLTDNDFRTRALFNVRSSYKLREKYSDKQEGLDRLKKLVKWHQKKLKGV